MSETIDELLASLNTRFANAEHEAQRYKKEAELIAAEIRGVRAAQNLLAPQAGNGAEPPRHRRPHRDIKALVREYLERPRPFFIPEEPSERASFIAQQIDCRPDQVVKALAAIDAEDGA